MLMEEVNFGFSGLGQSHDEDDDIPSMPCFEVSNAEDRPLAPEADEFPLGCEVELRDRDFARVAQEESRWDPLLEEVFSVPRRRVKVCRHLGDYTFVLCSDMKGYDMVGCTLYRACLSEPKVKTTKYYANVAAREEDDNLCAPDEVDGGDAGPEDVFDMPIVPGGFPSPPWLTEGGVQEDAANNSSSGSAEKNLPAAYSNQAVGDMDQKHELNLFDMADAPPAFTTSAPPPVPSAAEHPSATTSPQRPASSNSRPDSGGQRMTSSNIGQVRRRGKFASLMKKGTEEVRRKNYQNALRYYTEAMTEAPEEEARALSSRSVAYLCLNQTQEALADAKRVIHLTPEDFTGYLRAANVLRGMKQFADAQSLYKEALKRGRDNPIIRKLLLGNSVAMLYEARTKRLHKLKLTFDDTNTRVIAVARQAVKPGEIVLKETTPLTAVFTPHYAAELSGSGANGTVCQSCGKPFLDEGVVCNAIPGMTPELFRSIYPHPKPLLCSYGCHAVYCSDECRSRSWAFHHWVECCARGRWREGIKAVHTYLDMYIQASPESEVADEDRMSPKSVVEDVSPMVVASTIRVTVRMLSRMISGVWGIRDAVHMFDWIRISPVVEAQRDGVRHVLRGAYDALSKHFLDEERPRLSFELFERCYQRAKSNSITAKVTCWSEVALRAETRMTLRGVDPSSSSAQQHHPIPMTTHATGEANGSYTSTASVSAYTSLTEEQRRVLERVVATPRGSVPGTAFTILALFEVWAATGRTNMSVVRRRRPAGPSTGRPLSARDRAEAAAHGVAPPLLEPNVTIVQANPEAALALHLRATRAIGKGETFVSAAPPYPATIDGARSQ